MEPSGERAFNFRFVLHGPRQRSHRNVRVGLRRFQWLVRHRHNPVYYTDADRQRHRGIPHHNKLYGQLDLYLAGQLEIHRIVIMFTIGFVSDYRKLTPLWLALGAIASVAPAAAQYGFALSPMRAEMNLTPGAQRNGTLTIANDAKATARFRTEILDISIDKEAVPQFEKDISSEASFSCKDWITVNPMEGEMPAAGQIAHPLHFFASRPTCRSAPIIALLASSSLPQCEEGAVADRHRGVAASDLHVLRHRWQPSDSGRGQADCDREDHRTKSSGYRAIISVENSGLTNLRGAGKVDVLNEAGDVIQASDFPPVVILPSRTQRLPVVLNAQMPNGTYTVRARVDLGTNGFRKRRINSVYP